MNTQTRLRLFGTPILNLTHEEASKVAYDLSLINDGAFRQDFFLTLRDYLHLSQRAPILLAPVHLRMQSIWIIRQSNSVKLALEDNGDAASDRIQAPCVNAMQLMLDLPDEAVDWEGVIDNKGWVIFDDEETAQDFAQHACAEKAWEQIGALLRRLTWLDEGLPSSAVLERRKQFYAHALWVMRRRNAKMQDLIEGRATAEEIFAIE